METDKQDAAMTWAEEEERKEAEKEAAEAAANQPVSPTPPANPAQDPKNIEWMEEQIRLAKDLHGDSFGEDINEEF